MYSIRRYTHEPLLRKFETSKGHSPCTIQSNVICDSYCMVGGGDGGLEARRTDGDILVFIITALEFHFKISFRGQTTKQPVGNSITMPGHDSLIRC